MKLEVRCCCQPQKLLGWLDVGFNDARHLPRSIRFPKLLMTPGGGGFPNIVCVDLPVAIINTGSDSYAAIKAEGMTIDELKTLRGFTAA